MTTSHLLVERITKTILLIRGEKVLLDEHLAVLYGGETKVLIQAVKRNLERFPEDFMFQLGDEEWESLRSQFVTSKPDGRGGRRYAPYAFTQEGVAMLSGVLRSEQAIQVNIEIIEAFVRIREILATHHDLARKLAEIDRKYDNKFREIWETLQQLIAPKGPEKKLIGFRPK